MKKLLVISALEERLQEKIKGDIPKDWVVCFNAGEDSVGIKKNLPGTEILFTWPWFFKESYLETPDLKWVQSFTAGVDDYPLQKIEERNLLLTAAHGEVHAIPISEHVLGMILALTRNLIVSHEQKRTRSWKQLAMEEFAELHGKRIGILGIGNIGKEIAKKCKAMGMETLGMDIVQDRVPFVDRLYPPAELQKLLSGSDFVVITLPLTPGTKALIGEKELRTMKKEGILINVSRGGIVVEKDLIKALEQEWIAGACLDVFEEEPLSKESKLYQFENVVFSPHVSSRSPYHLERVVTFALENLRLYIAGKSLKGLVDYKLGY